jgi:type I restriction enzyme, S subunit
MTWPVLPLGEVAETALGKMLDRGRAKGHPHVPYLRNVNVQWGRINTDDLLTMELADDERERFAVHAGDLLVCEGGEIGRCAIWHGRTEYLAYQKALHRIRPSEKVDARFLRYLLEHHSLSGTLAGLATGSTIAHLPQQQLRRVPVPVPPLDVQRRIVDLLEDHLSRLDAAKAGLKSARRRLRALEQSALDARFGTDPKVPLADLIEDVSAGKSFGASNALAGDDEWGIIKVSAMTWGEFKPDENKAVPADRVDPRFEIREGDLLVSRANTAEYVGASVLVGPVRPQLLLSDKSLRITPRAEVHAEWLWRALQAPSARRQISALATGTKDSMRNVSQAALRQVLLPKVDPTSQVHALEAFAGVAEATTRMRAEISAAEQRCNHLRRSLLAAAFSGRLTGSVADVSDVEEMIGA